MECRHVFSLVGMFLFVSACAGTALKEPVSLETLLQEREYVQRDEVRSTRNYRISSWQSLDDHDIIINTGPSENYLLTFDFPCREIKFAEVIALSSIAGQVNQLDVLMVKDSAGLVRRCPIVSIHTLEKIVEK